MTPAESLIALKTHPRKWLERHYLITRAGTPQTFSAQQHHFGSPDHQGIVGGNTPSRTVGTQVNLGPVHSRGARTFIMTPTVLAAVLSGDATQASVINVPVVASASFNGVYAGLGLHDLGTALGRDFMVTTLLNGCSFVVNGANPSVLHIQPTGGMSSAALRAGLAPHYTAVFGGGGNEYDQNVEDVTIFGVRRGNGWKIYAQVHTRNVKNIVRVVKLHG